MVLIEEVRTIAAPYMANGVELVAIARQPERGLYQAGLRHADAWQRTGNCRLFIDMRNGKAPRIFNPRAGEYVDRFPATLFPLHSGQPGGPAVKWLIASGAVHFYRYYYLVTAQEKTSGGVSA